LKKDDDLCCGVVASTGEPLSLVSSHERKSNIFSEEIQA
jgi:hypothetical protein